MNSILEPIHNKVYVFKKHSLLYLESGSGIFQVDFRNYNFDRNKILFLSPGQYFQLLSGSFKIRLYEFSDQALFKVKNSRYLFQHLIGLGHIPLTEEKNYHSSSLGFLESGKADYSVLENYVKDWIILNPFRAQPEEIDLLFDIKSVIDNQFPRIPSLIEVSKSLQENPFRIHDLTKGKLEQSIQKWIHEKILLEAKRNIIFTNQSIKEIAYNTGFKDPNYFYRFFKLHTEKTPAEFREGFEVEMEDPFLAELNNLIENYYKKSHKPSFYAEKMGMSLKTFSRKLEKNYQTNFFDLIHNKLISESCERILKQEPFHGIAFDLGFKEPNHFTAFFKKHTGKTPSQYLIKI